MKNINDIDFYSISKDNARDLGPFGQDDYPVTVKCYGQADAWKSRKAAVRFYSAGANACGGSERDRYCNIVSGLECGLKCVSDLD